MSQTVKKILAIVLAAVLLGGGVLFCVKYSEKSTHWKEADENASRENAEAAAQRDALKNEVAEGEILLEQTDSDRLEAAEEEIASLEEETDELEKTVSEAEKKLSQIRSEEDYIYYQSVYSKLEEGKDKVETYIKESK